MKPRIQCVRTHWNPDSIASDGRRPGRSIRLSGCLAPYLESPRDQQTRGSRWDQASRRCPRRGPPRGRRADDRAALDAYVRRAMVNTHISWWRRRRLEEFPTDELPDQAVADHARESDMAEVVRRALDRLPHRMRAAVMLR